jgi:hypothetical protein
MLASAGSCLAAVGAVGSLFLDKDWNRTIHGAALSMWTLILLSGWKHIPHTESVPCVEEKAGLRIQTFGRGEKEILVWRSLFSVAWFTARVLPQNPSLSPKSLREHNTTRLIRFMCWYGIVVLVRIHFCGWYQRAPKWKWRFLTIGLCLLIYVLFYHPQSVMSIFRRVL